MLGNKAADGGTLRSAVVDITGHLGFGLPFAQPAWDVLNDRASVAFVSLAAVGSLLPDDDRWPAMLFPAEVHHHGVTQTVLCAAMGSFPGGAGLLRRRVEGWTGERHLGARRLFGAAALAAPTARRHRLRPL